MRRRKPAGVTGGRDAVQCGCDGATEDVNGLARAAEPKLKVDEGAGDDR